MGKGVGPYACGFQRPGVARLLLSFGYPTVIPFCSMFFSFLFTALLALRPATSPAPTGVDPCKIYGAIYLETDPRLRGNSFATVYIEPEEAFADVLVYQETNKLFADKAGLWYPADNREFADYRLFVTTDRNLAEFSIHYTKVRSFAGCRTK